MILYDTPYEQVVKVMMQEYDKTLYHLQKTDKQMFKRILKENGFFKPYVEQFTIPTSKNTYTVYSKMDKKGNMLRLVILVVNGEKGKKKIYQIARNFKIKSNSDKKDSDWVLDIFTGHFLSRYRERGGYKTLSSEELISTFLIKNMEMKPSANIPAKLVNPAIEDKDEYACPCPEGIVFRRVQQVTTNGLVVEIHENKTFIGENEMYTMQGAIKEMTQYFSKSQFLKDAQEGNMPSNLVMNILQSEKEKNKLKINPDNV